MDIKEMKNDILNETLYAANFESGLKAYVLPKEGFSKQYAIFATHYGSIDNKFKAPGDNDYTEVPDGIAHFLEHKLFEQEGEDAFERFSKLGSSPNAYTNYNTTAYLFSSTDKFYENFEILLDFVQNPYLTDENVEKEKGIIGQEIKMYDDDPNSKVFSNLMNCLYVNNPIRIDIAGTVESISKINKDTLYKCYNTFYHPSNMVVFAIGDIDHKKVFEMIGEKVNKPPKDKIEREKFDEPDEVKENQKEQSLSVSIPIFNIGFKDNNVGLKGKELLKKVTSSAIVLDMIFGRSSDFYNRLYNEGLINDNFGADFMGEERFCFAIIGGESKDPKLVKDKIVEEINKYLNSSLDKNAFERIKRVHLGRFLRQFDNIDRLAHYFIDYIFNDIMIFDQLEVLNNISFEDVSNRFKEMLDVNKMAISIINPI